MSKESEREALEKKALGALDYDPLGRAEELTGEEYHSPGATALGLDLLHLNSTDKQKLFQELGDTYSNMSWGQANELFTKAGFETIDEFETTGEYSEQQWKIYAHKDKKLFLVANSYPSFDEGIVLNSAMVYAKVDFRGERKDWWKILEEGHANTSSQDDLTWEISIDGREGILTKIKKIEEAGFVFVNWGGNDWKDDLDIPILGLSPENDLPFEKRRRMEIEKLRSILTKSPNWVREFIMEIPEVKSTMPRNYEIADSFTMNTGYEIHD